MTDKERTRREPRTSGEVWWRVHRSLSNRWTKRSERAIPYGPFARFSDRWCATRDGKNGVPALPPQDRPVQVPAGQELELGTPRMMFLGQLALGRIEKEWVVYQAEIAAIEARLRDSTARRDSLLRELDTAEKRLKLAQETPQNLCTRVAGEERTEEPIVHQRRTLELTRRREREAVIVRDLTIRLDAVEAQVAQFDEQIKIRRRITQRRVAMIEAHSRRRCAAYLTWLVRKHPQGAELNELLRPRWPEQSEWARAHRGPDADTAHGVDTRDRLDRARI
jgi:hypothetical protein